MQHVIIEEIDGYTTRNLVQSKINDILKEGWTVSNVTMEKNSGTSMIVVFVLSKKEENNKKKII